MNAEDARRSISATLAEIEASRRATGAPVDRQEIDEAQAIIARIEARLRQNGQAA